VLLNKKLKNNIFFIAILVLLNMASLYAEIIKKVNIAGNKRIDNIYIISIISSKENTEYSQDKSSEDIKQMYSTGLFEKIEFSFNNGVLDVVVVENLLIGNITISGNSKIKEEVITKEILTKSRSNFSQNKLNLDIQRITDMYYRSGFLTASVTYKIIEKDFNIIDIEINIIENVKNVIKKINFIGNNAFSKKELESIMLTKEDKWWRFLNAGNVYDKSRIAYDGELLKQFYFQKGYPNFTVISTTTEISPITKEFEVTYVISEGERYKFGEVNFIIDIADMVQYENKFLKIAKLNPSDWFKASEVQSKIFELTEEVKRLKYQFIAVSEKLSFNDTLKTVNITFVISQESRLFVDKIETRGNTKTKDYVIRRQLKFNEGDDFSTTKTTTATRNLYRTQFFGNVQIQESSNNEPGKVNVIVNVEERPTGAIQAGGGFSTLDKFSLNAKYSDTNIFGTGNTIALSFDVSSYNTNYSLEYANPYFLNRELYGSIGISHRETSNLFGQNTSRLRDSSATSFSLGVGHNITNNIRQTVRYKISYEVEKLLSTQKTSKNIVSEIENIFSYDSTDNGIYPTKGIITVLNTNYAGLWGDIYSLNNGIKSIWYQKIYNDIVFSALTGAYATTPIGKKEIPFNRLEKVDSRELRGFNSDSGNPVGPYNQYLDFNGVSQTDVQSLGAKYKFRGSFQLQTPFPGNTNYSLLVYIFNDYAVATNFNPTKNGEIKTSGIANKNLVYQITNQNDSIRSSYGFGLTWVSPLGIIKIGLGWPLLKKSGDGVQRLFLDFGTEF
jgi:outer membrane protein insertion porin family